VGLESALSFQDRPACLWNYIKYSYRLCHELTKLARKEIPNLVRKAHENVHAKRAYQAHLKKVSSTQEYSPVGRFFSSMDKEETRLHTLMNIRDSRLARHEMAEKQKETLGYLERVIPDHLKEVVLPPKQELVKLNLSQLYVFGLTTAYKVGCSLEQVKGFPCPSGLRPDEVLVWQTKFALKSSKPRLPDEIWDYILRLSTFHVDVKPEGYSWSRTGFACKKCQARIYEYESRKHYDTKCLCELRNDSRYYPRQYAESFRIL